MEKRRYNHNLVNALYAMKGLLESCLVSEAPAGSQEILKRACGQADQALRIAKRLGRVLVLKEEKKNGNALARVSVRPAWQRTIRTLKKEFSPEEIEIIERIPEPFPFLLCEPKDLEEIFYHLTRNAIQAMRGKGRLVIRVQLSFSTKEEAFATIQIADSGPGIRESRLSSLFLPFFTTKPRREGAGLGLYLTRRLVLRNHGRITVSSFIGFGTTFTLEFPLAKK